MSAIIAQFAVEHGGDNGATLIDKEAVAAAKMRVEMERCGALQNPLYKIYASRGEDLEKNKALTPSIIEFAKIIEKADNKWLFGTEEPTMLDVYFAPIWKIFSDLKTPSVMHNMLDDTNYKENGGNHRKEMFFF